MSGKLGVGEEDRSAILRRVWDITLQLLSTKVNTVAFESFIRTIQPLSYQDGTITLGVTSAYQKDRLEKAHHNAIRTALEFHLDEIGLNIVFTVLTSEQRNAASKRSNSKRTHPHQIALALDGEAAAIVADESISMDLDSNSDTTNTEEIAPQKTAVSKTSAKRADSKKPAPVRPSAPCLPLNDRYKLPQYLVGVSNRLAFAGAQAVVERPGSSYNPLFIYSGPGLGKTHLLQGIAHALKEKDPELRVSYVSGEYFAQSYIKALKEHTTEAFRKQYREVDVWVVDDIQFIAGKEQTKEEFFHTFNSLFHGGKQIVLGSDRSPKDLNTLDERLRSRFQSGLIADITAPDAQTRIEFLKACRTRENADVSDSVLNYIANSIPSNMRSLEGALTRLMAYSSIMNAPMNEDLVQEVLGEYITSTPIRCRTVTPEIVMAAVAEEFGVTVDELKGPRRSKDLSNARQAAMYLCRELIASSNLASIGTVFGGRDHATVVYACQRVRARAEAEDVFRETLKQLSSQLIRPN